MTTLSTSQLAALRTKARILIGLTDESAGYRTPAFNVYDDGSVNLTTSTVSVLYNETTNAYELGFTGSNVSTTYDLDGAANETLDKLIALIRAADDGLQVTLLHPDGSTSSNLLEQLISTNCFGTANEQTLYVDSQPKLDQIIQAVFSSVETVLGRSLFSTDYTQRYRLDSGLMLTLDEPDVSSVQFVGVELTDALTVTYAGSDTRATIEVTDTAVISRSRSGVTTTTTTATFAANASTTDIKTAIEAAVGGGWTVTVTETMPSAYLARQGAQSAKSIEVVLPGYEDYDGPYRTDYTAGLIEFDRWPFVVSPWGASDWSQITYTAGFATLPADIEGVILNIVKSAWDESEKDGSVTEEKLGDYSYKIAEGAAQNALADITPYESVISKYRRWRP